MLIKGVDNWISPEKETNCTLLFPKELKEQGDNKKE